MTYLSTAQVQELGVLLRTFFSLPYSTDLDGKDAETLIRLVKGATGPRSKRKELFDVIDGTTGYSIKTLFKPPASTRVDLQEQRFCDVEEVRKMRTAGSGSAATQGRILLGYMHDRIREQMAARGIRDARSIILLKHWDTSRTRFEFKYWEEDFLGFVANLVERDRAGEIEWVVQEAGLHARDRLRISPRGRGKAVAREPVRLLRMHYKHNQIFTDHDIPDDAETIAFDCSTLTWNDVAKLVEAAHRAASE